MPRKGKRPMKQVHSCSNCKKSYAMDWARNNHQRRCKEKDDAMENHPERYQ